MYTLRRVLSKIIFSLLLVISLQTPLQAENATGLFVIGGQHGTLFTSTDGVTWTQRSVGANVRMLQVLWNNKQFLATGWDENTFNDVILTSPDGLRWTIHLLTSSYSVYSRFAPSWDGNQYIATGADVNSNSFILTSADGLSWIQKSKFTQTNLVDVVWTGAQYVAIGDKAKILTSPDLVNWSQQSSGIRNDTYLRRIIWTGTQFIIAGTNVYVTPDVGVILTSPDGVRWTTRYNAPFGTGSFLNSIIVNASQYVVGGYDGFLVSQDSINWFPSQIPGSINQIIWNGSQYVAVGYSNTRMGLIFTSPDGTHWTQRTSNTPFSLDTVAWGTPQAHN